MSRDEKLPESTISYVLMGGLVISMVIEVVGILAYFSQSGGFGFEFSRQWQVTGPNFFAYTLSLLDSVLFNQTPLAIMALGVVLLMFTSYTRVFTSMLYFAFAKNPKYTAISLFLFAVLTVTLFAH